MARIEGPNGCVANVDTQGRLTTTAATQTLAQQLALDGNAFTVFFEQTPVGADDIFFYVKNVGIRDIALGLFSMSATVITRITVEPVTGTPVYVTNGGLGTQVTPANLNLGSTNLLSAEIVSDTDVTGLTSGGVIAYEEIDTVGIRRNLQVNPGFIIPQGKSFALRSTVSSTITCSVSIGIITVAS